MATNIDPLLQRVQTSYERLTLVASNLNSVSDDLGKVVNALDESLKKLNIGITTWYRFSLGSNDADPGAYLYKYIGYSRMGNKWGISLRREDGHEAYKETETVDQWLFNDAPRELRLEAVTHIPAMIDALIQAGEEEIEKIGLKTLEAKQLAAILSPTTKQASKPSVLNPGGER